MNGILSPLWELESFLTLRDAIRNGKTPALATGVVDSQKWHVAAALMEAENRTALVVTASELKAKEVFEDLYYFLHDRVSIYPSRDAIFYAADVKSADITRQRFKVIDALRSGRAAAVIVSAEALLDRLTPVDIFVGHIKTLSVGDLIAPEAIARFLVMAGYERAPLVEGPGQFALRGGIMDVYAAAAMVGDSNVPLSDGQALRLEFFGDEIDSIRLLDVYSQRSTEKTQQATFYPMRELVCDETVLKNAIARIQAELEQTKAAFRRKNKRAEAQTLSDTVQEIITRLSEEMRCPGMESFFPYFYPSETTLLDYFPADALLFFDEPNRISSHMETVFSEFEDSVEHRLLSGHMLPGQAKMLLSFADILYKTNSFDRVLLASIPQSLRDFNPASIVHFAVKSCSPLRRKPDDLREDIAYWLNRGSRVVILAGARRHGQTLTEEIAQIDLPVRYVDAETENLPPSMVTVLRGTMTAGFEYPEIGLVVVTEKEIFAAEKKRRRISRRSKQGAKIEHFTDLSLGDYVVHDNHGIGVFKGIEQIVTDGYSRDYLKLEYADGGHLYVHTGQMDLIQKYIGSQAQIKLNKLGGADWVKAKARTRKAVAILASDLIALYAKRQSAQGFVYGPDTVWQAEFEAQFPYEETDDQLAAIADVKKDMETGKIMDRLICGDVGYGKTEVAIRAAFKAVQDNKQVAYLVPTTILAQQHFLTFQNRLKDYPVTIERLSRFQTRKEQQEAVARMANGVSDIVIGTHRLLSKDVKFHNLGLVIVDEEQRFGVSHKEKLKSLKENVNVLALTATPIPRTLHLSLTGIRDMSLLDEPPEERRPVQTYVMEYNAEFVRDAISRELARGGQVYYLHNRVRNIAEEAVRVQALAPYARVAFAHGQMSEHELENVMLAFIEGQIQVLVCTTIVESGLDIPNVNTIIIQDADYMGLSQLYQLRGRVGRSNRLAYAYLMYRKDKVLEENAEKRLQTIREFTEFGAGFKVAMRDLEIRGAGNLLGAEQHGHMDAVGYDMYCKLLSEAVAELSGEPVAEKFETAIDIRINAYIPDYFISDELQKLEAYKKISLITSQQDFYEVQEEIEDRFGTPPKPVQNLLEVALLKAVAHALGVISITQRQSNVVITFRADAAVDVNRLTTAITQEPDQLFFTMAPNPYLTCRVPYNADSDGSEAVLRVQKLLEGLHPCPQT